MNLSDLLLRIAIMLFAGNSIMGGSQPAEAPLQRSDVEVMILGTFHFTGGGSDVVNPEVDDFLSPGRQTEIADVLDRLEKYAPNKIMLELNLEREQLFNQAYGRYVDGEHELTVNERQQLGMRLAARLKHNRLYAIDFDNFLDYRGALAAAEELGQEHLLKAMDAQIDAIRASLKKQENLNLRERLIQLNSPANFDHSFYMNIAQMGSLEDPKGALQILTWWERNLVMFARTAQQAEPGDRILIIVGAGHNYILNEFFNSADGFELVSPLSVLK